MVNEHDPLCSNQPGYFDGSIDWYAQCECALIAKARADEREKAAQRIEELGCSEACGCSITIPNAIAAARGEAS